MKQPGFKRLSKKSNFGVAALVRAWKGRAGAPASPATGSRRRLLPDVERSPQPSPFVPRPSPIPPRPSSLVPRAFALLLLAWLPFTAAAGADPFASLREPVRVDLVDGRSFTGEPAAFQDDVLYLRMRIADGEVDRGFPTGQIRNIHFPGAELETIAHDLLDKEMWHEAVPIVEALWRNRAPFLRLLDDNLLELLYRLPDLRLRTGNPGRAIALADELLPHTRDAGIRESLQSVKLRGHFALGLYPEAEALARDWVRQQGRFPRSALGWKMLGELALKKEEYERAAWTALQPVAFAGPFATPHLADCYAIAILAFHHLDEPSRSARLAIEMNQLRLHWPDEERFAAVRALYEPEDEEPVAAPVSPEDMDLDLRPPAEDLNLPLKDVRKLIITSD